MQIQPFFGSETRNELALIIAMLILVFLCRWALL
jgi:hypothetical protein